MQDQFVELLLDAYPGRRVDTGTVRMYMALFETMSQQEAVAVVSQAIGSMDRSAEFFPTISRLRCILAEVRAGRQKPAPQAWGEVLKEVGRLGRNRQPERLDDLTMQAVDAIGGWTAVCNSTNQVADRARFVEAYRELAPRHLEKSARMELPEGPVPIGRLISAPGKGRRR